MSTKYTHEETKRNYKGDLNPDRLPDLERVVMNIITDYDTVYKLYEFEIVHSDRLEKKLGDAKTMERFWEMAKLLADSHRK
ncbi:MAG: hypothetical protein KGH61_02790 [Candidatus Micrarchaeota archaeon]|nr:hypothetical protein [Candidatus Micrarchaeota archaeon]MDE1847851.1 hypothetical protein [Candidatus Micrarchaeota archaeon]MDE1864178.1 hypothetical protein [Candidatus Micrarchaeota archaeon]